VNKLQSNQQSEPEADRRLRALLDAGCGPLLVIALPSGDIVDANQAAGDALGYTPADLQTRTLGEVFAPRIVEAITTLQAAQPPLHLTVDVRQDTARALDLCVRRATFEGQAYALAVGQVRDEPTPSNSDAQQRTEALYALARALISSQGLSELLQVVVDSVRDLLEADSVILVTLDVARRKVLNRVQAGPADTSRHAVTFEELWDGLSGWAIRHGRPALSSRTQQFDPREGEIARGHRIVGDTGAVLVVPLQYRDRTLGTLTAVNHIDRPDFTERDAELMTAMANQAAAAIANARLYHNAQERAQEQEQISRILRALNALDIRSAFPILAAGLRELTGCERVVLALIDEQYQYFEVVGLDSDFEVFEKGTVLPLVDGQDYEDLMAGSPQLTPDLAAVEGSPVARELYAAGVRSKITLPLLIGGETTGFLSMGSREVDHFDPSQVPTLQQVADAVAIAVENSRLFAAQRRQREFAERLQETALVVNTLDLDEVLDLIMDQLSRIFPYESSTIQILEHDTMRVIAARNLIKSPIGRRYPLDHYPYNRRLAQGEVVVIQDMDVNDLGWVPFDDVRHVRSNIGVPLWVRDRVIGALTIDSSEPNAYSERDVRVVQAFAQQAAIAIENARLFEEQRAQRTWAESLARAATVVTSALEIDEVLDHILEQVAQVVNGDTFHILLIEGDRGRIIRWRGYEQFGVPAEAVARDNIPIFDYPYILDMIQNGEPVLVPDTEADPHWISKQGRGWRRSYLSAPIRIAGETEGFLNVNGTQPYQLGPQDARRLKAFADHAAIALENARLFQMTRQNAKVLAQRVRERTAELEAKNAWLEAILSSTSDGIIVTDGAGDIVQANRVTRDWLDHALSDADAATLRKAVRELARRSRERPDTVLELTGLDLELRASPISGQSGQRPAVVVAVHDVSYLKALDRMKSEFISNISHELRTPLTSIRLYSALLQQTPSDRTERYFEALDCETDRLTGLVEDVLQISRIEAGRLELSRRTVDLNVLVESAVASHEILASSRGLILRLGTTSSPMPVFVDPDKFRQVLNNLIENAIYYTLEGGKITVSTRCEVKKGKHWAVVEVQDTGIGISEEETAHLFERFFRGMAPQEMQIQGSGLGLAIVKEITELHGGSVAVESQEGVGSVFTVRVALSEVPEMREA
jgi:signal transduction histidine kinase